VSLAAGRFPESSEFFNPPNFLFAFLANPPNRRALRAGTVSAPRRRQPGLRAVRAGRGPVTEPGLGDIRVGSASPPEAATRTDPASPPPGPLPGRARRRPGPDSDCAQESTVRRRTRSLGSCCPSQASPTRPVSPLPWSGRASESRNASSTRPILSLCGPRLWMQK
jgi:hypothetical protein